MRRAQHAGMDSHTRVAGLALGILVLATVRGVGTSPAGSAAAAGMARAGSPIVLRLTPAPNRSTSPADRLAPTAGPRYPYHSRAFTQFVADSYRGKRGSPDEFYRWMERTYHASRVRYPGKDRLGLEELLAWKRQDLGRVTDPAKRAKEEIRFASWLHKMVKATIPHFSLDRGFEFFNVVRYGERQCFLQGVLIAAMLQSVGADAGVVMVYRNIQGGEINNGHALALLKLPNGRDIMVDASEDRPFPLHRGLFVRAAGGYRYADPLFEKRSATIGAYRLAGRGARLPTAQALTLDTAFIRSQFYYYRGERAKGGPRALRPSREGLEEAARQLAASVRLCPRNPLAVYMLGRAYRIEGRAREARRLFEDAYRLYARSGWVPRGPSECAAAPRG